MKAIERRMSEEFFALTKGRRALPDVRIYVGRDIWNYFNRNMASLERLVEGDIVDELQIPNLKFKSATMQIDTLLKPSEFVIAVVQQAEDEVKASHAVV